MRLFPLRLLPEENNINFMKKRNISLYLSVICVICSFLLVSFKGMNFGIDFTGGILLETRFQESVEIDELREFVAKQTQKFDDNGEAREISIQNLSGGQENEHDFIIRISALSAEMGPYQEFVNFLKEEMEKNLPKVEFRKIDYVGPQVGDELIFDSLLAIFLSFIAIMIYVAFRFRWQFSVGIVLALIHDVIVTVGILSFLQIEFNLTTIAALLTVVGYSVNDSVVIYDRIRENLRKYRTKSFHDIINLSINETLSRTVLTVFTTLLAIVALLMFGSENIFSFSLTAFLGIIIGTYSSIYISAPILIYFKKENEE